MSLKEPAPSPLDRALRVMGDVRRGEGRPAFMLAISGFVLMTAYYLLKVVREGLLLRRFSPEAKVYIAAGQAVLIVIVVEAWSWLSARVSRERLFSIASVFFALNLAGFFALGHAGVEVGAAFFVWVGVFNVIAVSQFWTLANDVYDEAEGKRLFAIAGLGVTSGSALGAKLAGWLREPLGPYAIMGVAAALLLVQRAIAIRISRKAQHEDPPPPLDTRTALSVLLRDRYLLWLGVLMPLLNWVNTTGEYVLDKVMKASIQADVARALGATAGHAFEEMLDLRIELFRSDFFLSVNVLTLLLQLFVVSRLLTRAGVRVALLVMPIVSLVGQLGMAFSLTLAVVALAKIAENSVDYSIQATTRHALFLVVSRDAKYKAKGLIDGFFHRFGDVLAGGFVFVATTYLQMTPRGFVLVNAVLVIAWIAVAIRIGKAHAALARQNVSDERRDPRRALVP